jgi:hypothetical protein
VNEALIAEATHLPITRENWSNNCMVKNIPWNEFLISKKMAYNPKGMPIFQLKRNGEF